MKKIKEYFNDEAVNQYLSLKYQNVIHVNCKFVELFAIIGC